MEYNSNTKENKNKREKRLKKIKNAMIKYRKQNNFSICLIPLVSDSGVSVTGVFIDSKDNIHLVLSCGKEKVSIEGISHYLVALVCKAICYKIFLKTQ